MALNVNTNLSALIAQRNLGRANNIQNNALGKLSSGFKINSAKDNPAGLIISEYLRSQLGGIERSVRNSQEAYNTLSIAEGGMNEMSNMLTRMRSLAIGSANTGVAGSGQVSANQAELNGMLNTFARIADTTRYSDQNLLNGAQSITYAAGGDTEILDQSATSINLVAEDAAPVDMSFAGGQANQAEKAYVESNEFAGGTLTSDVSFTIEGSEGSRELSFNAGTEISEVADQINNISGSTGVTAYSIKGDTQLRLVSENYGSEATVEVSEGTNSGELFTTAGETVSDSGQDATLTIKGVEVETSGLTADVANSAFSGTIAFNEGDPADTSIAQVGYDQDSLTDADTAREVQLGDIRGGMQLQLGEGAGTQNRETFGLRNMNLSNLGQVTVDGEEYSMADLMSGGTASLAANPEVAMKVIDQAIADVSGERGRIGAYQANTLQTNINSLQVAAENVASTESGIRDANMAEEMTNFIRGQILSRVGAMNVQSANMSAKNVLSLLGG